MGIVSILILKGADIYYGGYFKPNLAVVASVLDTYLKDVKDLFFSPTSNLFLLRIRMIFLATFVATFGWFAVHILLKWVDRE